MTTEVKMVAWSPTMDLLAIGTTCGKVSMECEEWGVQVFTRFW